VDEIGIVGKVGDSYAVNIVYVGEDWVPYESRLKSTLYLFGIPLAGLMLGILIMIMVGIYIVTDRRHVRRSTAFFIASPAELFGRIVTSTFFWILEFVCGAILVSIILFSTLNRISPGIGWLVFLVGGASAIFMPVIYLVAAWLLKYYHRQPFRFMVSMFLWGVMAALAALLANMSCTLLLGTVLGRGIAYVLVAVMVAPIIEETSKGTGVLLISGRREFRGMLNGILYGFAIGMGFAFIENWLYFAVNASPVASGGVVEWAYTILYRSFIDSLGHGCFTGITGGFVGYFKSRQLVENFAFDGFRRGLPIAIAMHSTFNAIDILSSYVPVAFGVPLPLFDPLLTLIIVIFYICLGIYIHFREKYARLRGDNGQGRGRL
jgi:RsiW-degrading membrane proteinase PrsW (M82 family)